VQRFLRALEAAETAGITIGPPPSIVVPRELEDKARRLAAGALPDELKAESQDEYRKTLLALARQAADKGVDALREYYKALTKEERASIEKIVLEELVPLAKAAG
jgi:hypothetical protein